MALFDIVTVGDAVLDCFLSLEHATEFARLKKETDEICIKEGVKVMVDDASFLLGGNASNVAVGISRLGLSSSLIAELGNDEFAQKLVKSLEKEHVDITHTIKSEDASTFAVILNLLGDRIAFVRHVAREHKFSFVNLETKWVYLTSLGKEWKEAYQNTAAYVKQTLSTRSAPRLAFNPGSTQIQEGAESLTDMLAVTDVLFVNRDEAEILLHGKVPEKSLQEIEENLLFRIQRMGPKVIVMTDGEKGSYCMTEKAELLYQEVYPSKVIEKTGAGDAYASGFLAALLSGKDIKAAMQWGAANSAAVLEQVGGEAGLLTKEGLEHKIAE